MSFETHFQDYEIENPAVVLQEALRELWKKAIDGIWAEVAMVSRLQREEGCRCQV